MTTDIDTLWRILEELPEAKTNATAETYKRFRSRFPDINSVFRADKRELTESFGFPESFYNIIELVFRANLNVLLRNIQLANDEELPLAIKVFSREFFVGKDRNTLITFFFRDGEFLEFAEPGSGTLFHFTFYPREVIGKALANGANQIFLVFGSVSDNKRTVAAREQFVDTLRESGSHLELEIADPVVLPVRVPRPEVSLPNDFAGLLSNAPGEIVDEADEADKAGEADDCED